MDTEQELERKFASLFPGLDERQRRLVAAAEARSLGYGGISRVSRASGLSRLTIQRALKELDSPSPTPAASVTPAVAARSSGTPRRRGSKSWRS